MGNKVLVTTTDELRTDRKLVEAAVEEDLAKFNEWFQSLGKGEEKNEPLTKAEHAIIKTFLYWKLFEEKPDGT